MRFSEEHGRTLGATGIAVTPLTLAGWSFAGRAGPMGRALSPDEVERSFHELGVRSFFVTPGMTSLADGVRRLVRSGHRDEITILSVAGLPTAGRVRAYARRCCRALGTDRIDVLLMGWVQRRWYLRPSVWSAMQELVRSGRARALGYSIHDRCLAARLAAELEPPPDVLMIRYNAAHRGAEKEVFARLPEPTPGVVAYTATRWGELLEARPELGFPDAVTAAECYRFCLGHPAVDTVLCGARTWSEIVEDVGEVARGPLRNGRRAEVARFGDAVHAHPARRGSRFMFDR